MGGEGNRMRTKQSLRIFAVSSGGRLFVDRDLLNTLCIELSILTDPCEDEAGVAKRAAFLQSAQAAYDGVYQKILRRDINFILWFRTFLREARGAGVWIPGVFLKRLRQIERGELELYDRQGRITLPLHADLPTPFVEACEFLGLKFSWIVPSFNGRKYVDVFTDSEEPDPWVRRIVDVWLNQPTGLSRNELRQWLKEQLPGLF